MRRILSHHWRVDGEERLLCSRRLLRRRRARAKEDVESASPVDVQSIRSGGMPAAPANSLDDIRAEIHRMRSSAPAAREEVTNKRGTISTMTGEETSVGDAWKQWMDKIRPSEAYYKGQDVVECVKAKDCMARRQLFLDAQEVLRRKNKDDTLRYLQLVQSRIGSYHREEVMEAVNALMQSVGKETQRVVNEIREVHGDAGFAMEDDIISSGEARQMAWVNVLSGMSDAELRNLWKWGVLDMDTIESLASVHTDGEARAEDLNSVRVDEAGEPSSASAEGSGEVKTEGVNGSEDSLVALLPIEENINALRSVCDIQELMACVSENLFLGLPTIDVAVPMQKAQQKRYEDISERELRLLERYEEAKLTIPLPTTDTTPGAMTANTTRDAAKTNADTCASVTFNHMHGNGKDKAQDVDMTSTEALPHGDCSTEAKKAPSSKLEITEAMMDRAFSPSNRFLHAVSRHDAALRRSIDGMERIKRLALLDPVFQAAVEEAQAWEESSVLSHRENVGEDEKMGNKETLKQRRLRRTRSGFSILGGPLAKPHHAADIPHFYGSMRSFVPPSGRYNMPAPRLSREEAAHLRGSARKKSRMRHVR